MTNEEQQGIIKNLTIALDEVSNLSKTLRDERDEARVKMADALQDVDLRTLDFERMKQERDEALFLLKSAQAALDAIHSEVGGWIKTMIKNTD
jgi:hypothetical protein